MRYHSSLWLIIGVFIYSLTAWFSEGYHHPDEHFQILEFAFSKLQPTPLPHSLAWEYDAQIRPGLQPFLAWCLMKLFTFINISNPFVQSFLLRWLTGMASLVVYYKFIKHFADNQKVIALISILFLWFMPYLSVRFSSEQTSGLAFLIGIYAVLREPHWKSWGVAGLFFCLSFYLRFQMGFALLGVGTWLLWHHHIAKTNKKAWFGLIAGGFFGFVLGTVADYWLYQKWVFPYINYFIII
jgi:phosphatidylinositol glycan class B